jgi:hypothetical protein
MKHRARYLVQAVGETRDIYDWKVRAKFAPTVKASVTSSSTAGSSSATRTVYGIGIGGPPRFQQGAGARATTLDDGRRCLSAVSALGGVTADDGIDAIVQSAARL